ncbi:hypothetical protein [Thiomicrorhabdus sp.]|uniref:hypothetical protein n=1 Tax=Thiomicrorhabdus sp. TaxID=2039724 RepID=UPI0029C8CA18|nr:hypothetical protein [Thiomicrorhabdus sp.]
MLNRKLIITALVLLSVTSTAQAGWWDSTKEGASEAWEATKDASSRAWQSTKETVSEWRDEAADSNAAKEVKKLGEKETYVKAWDEAKKASDNVLEKE